MEATKKLTALLATRAELDACLSNKLRKSILQQAIQGLLVEQNPDDEPASVLLEKIKTEKEHLVKEKRIKRDKQESIIYRGDDNKYYENLNGVVIDITDQIPFEIPDSWEWVRLRALCGITTGASFKKEEVSIEAKNKIRILRGGNIQPFKLVLKDDDIFIDNSLVKKDILLRENDLVTPAVTSLENICKMARIEQDYSGMTMGGFVFIIRGYLNDKTIAQYLQCVFSCPTTIEFVRSITNKSGQAFYNIGKERLSNTLIPLPPHSEMKRITNQVNMLFQSLN
ncbi:MAG: restriction endonuclease subunit S [Muribaculaceae bacterium]|nr:restriction endonuclease subunit S [Muribaculaceae bacterium]